MNIDAQPVRTKTATPRKKAIGILSSFRTDSQPIESHGTSSWGEQSGVRLTRDARGTHDKDGDHDGLEKRRLHRETANVPVVHLVNPERCRRADKEQRELNRDREHQDEVVHAVDHARRADALERLPAERLCSHDDVSYHYTGAKMSSARTFMRRQLRKPETSRAKQLSAKLGISAFERVLQ